MAFIGQVIDNKYEILQQIGEGGMSKVYLARDNHLKQQWAVKEVQKQGYDKNDRLYSQAAIGEAEMIRDLDHPAIIRIVDIIETDQVLYIVEDLVEGRALDEILDEQGAQPQKDVVKWAIQICEALNYLHSRPCPIIYRDMKPSNIMLKPDGNIKIIDFGTARTYKETSVKDTVSFGTKGYAAPEQFGGKGQTDARTDIYCLGVTLYHLLTGKDPSEPPYEIYPIRHWNPQLSAGLEVVIQKCTQNNPDDRYQSCEELLNALQNYEKFSIEYRTRQKKKLWAFTGTVMASILCCCIGILGFGMKKATNNADYTLNISQAEKAASEVKKAELYSKAIEIKPLKLEAYFGLVETFKEDASFSTDEEKILANVLNKNLVQLKEQQGYADLAFEVGKLYWYYYDYGKGNDSNNQITRMKSAIQWFEDAAKSGGTANQHYTMSSIYSEIGKFNRDITLNVEEASDKGLYAPYWENITKLVDMVSDNDENEIIKLEVYRLAVYSIETYSRKFKADGVTKRNLELVLNETERALSNTSTTSDKTEEIKMSVMDRLPSAKEAIENAYRELVIEK